MELYEKDSTKVGWIYFYTFRNSVKSTFMMLCLNAGSVVKLVVSEFQTLIGLPQLQFEYAVSSFWVLRKSRPKEILILAEAIQAKNMTMHKVLKLSRLHTVYTFEYASTTHNEYFLFTVNLILVSVLSGLSLRLSVQHARYWRINVENSLFPHPCLTSPLRRNI